jgi:hypothetical protein
MGCSAACFSDIRAFGYPPKPGVAMLIEVVIVALIGVSWMAQRSILRSGKFATLAGGECALPRCGLVDSDGR